MKVWYILIAFLFIFSILKAQPVYLENFIVKENLLKNDKLAVVAADKNENPVEGVNGTFLFNVNGFKQELEFHDGVAITPQAIDKSTFVYLKHKNDSTSKAKLYYVLKKEGGINPVKVNWSVFILIPLLLVILASVFRKLIVFVVIIFLGMFLFNSANGLSLPTFFDTIMEGLKSFIH